MEDKIKDLQDQVDSEVLRMRDMSTFIVHPSCSDADCQAFTKSYAKISNNVDALEHQIFKLKKGK